MNTRYGYSPVDWNNTKEEIRRILIERAKVRGKIPYSELVEQVQTIHLEPDFHALASMLGEISSEEDAAGHGMLTVIVVHKSGDMQPGSGFFELANELGRDTTDILKCWADELRTVHAFWSTS